MGALAFTRDTGTLAGAAGGKSRHLPLRCPRSIEDCVLVMPKYCVEASFNLFKLATLTVNPLFSPSESSLSFSRSKWQAHFWTSFQVIGCSLIFLDMIGEFKIFWKSRGTAFMYFSRRDLL
jgi:hypothetical protein